MILKIERKFPILGVLLITYIVHVPIHTFFTPLSPSSSLDINSPSSKSTSLPSVILLKIDNCPRNVAKQRIIIIATWVSRFIFKMTSEWFIMLLGQYRMHYIIQPTTDDVLCVQMCSFHRMCLRVLISNLRVSDEFPVCALDQGTHSECRGGGLTGLLSRVQCP